MARLGLLGGTFNPVHLGHLRAAEEVLEAKGLDRMLFIPSASPPHKGRDGLASAEARLEMCRLAVADNPRFEASDLELRRGGRSYSIGTLRDLHARGERDLWFVIGTDAFGEVETWKDWRALFEHAHFVVMSRPGAALDLASLIPIEVRDRFCYDPERRVYTHPSGYTVSAVTVTPLDISSSQIRALRASGRSIRYLAPDAVEAYIRERGLYREEPKS